MKSLTKEQYLKIVKECEKFHERTNGGYDLTAGDVVHAFFVGAKESIYVMQDGDMPQNDMYFSADSIVDDFIQETLKKL